MIAVIFDCDGTLVDSEPLSFRAWGRALAAYGHELGADELAGFLGRSYATTHAYFASVIAGLPAATEFWADYSREAFHLIDTELVPFADAVGAVAALRERGVPVAVASSSPRERVDRTLAAAGLTGAFAISVAGDEVAHSKPEPERSGDERSARGRIFLRTASLLGVSPAECVVVEDAPPGVAAGVAAGMTVVGVARTATDLAGAHVVLEELSAEAILAAARARSATSRPSPP